MRTAPVARLPRFPHLRAPLDRTLRVRSRSRRTHRRVHSDAPRAVSPTPGKPAAPPARPFRVLAASPMPRKPAPTPATPSPARRAAPVAHPRRAMGATLPSSGRLPHSPNQHALQPPLPREARCPRRPPAPRHRRDLPGGPAAVAPQHSPRPHARPCQSLNPAPRRLPSAPHVPLPPACPFHAVSPA